MLKEIISGKPVRSVILSDLTEMANMVGKKIITDDVNFSFYFSNKNEVNHGIRAKVKWNKEHLTGSTDGYFELHGNYNYVQSMDGKIPKQSDIQLARKFFKKYKVLFAAVWENCLDANDLQDYFKGYLSFEDLLNSFLIPEKFTGIKSLSELENYVRENSIYNLND